MSKYIAREWALEYMPDIWSGISANKNLPDIPWGSTFHGERRAFRSILKEPRDIWLKYLKDIGCEKVAMLVSMVDQPTNKVVPFFSKLNAKIHEHLDEYGSPLTYFLDLATIAGYPVFKHREMVDSPSAWLEEEVDDQHSKEWWTKGITYALVGHLDVSSEYLSLDDYLGKPWLWATPGAMKGSKLFLDGKEVKTKTGYVLSHTLDEIKELYHNQKPNISIFIKPDEKGYKRRLIANVNFRLYIVSSYIRHMLINNLSRTTPYLQWDTRLEEVEALRLFLKNGYTMYPIDESRFDYHVSRASWEGFIDTVGELQFVDSTAVRDFKEALDTTTWQTADGERGKWKKGMPSGLGLTTFCNSLFNYVKQRQIFPDSYLNWACGDDSLLASNVQYQPAWVGREYEKFGAEVNPSKVWRSTKYAEYLKELFCEEGALQYPARAFSTIIWSDRSSKLDRLSALFAEAENFKMYYDRLGNWNLKEMCSDLARSISQTIPMKTRDIEHWLKANPAYGGFGLWMGSYNSWMFNFKTEVITRKKYSGQVYALRPLLETKLTSYTKVFNFEPDLPFEPSGYEPLKPILDIQDWIDSINDENELPVAKRYRPFFNELVPLPKIPNFSSKWVSGFGKDMAFYANRCLRGSFDRTRRRLGGGSRELALNFIFAMKRRELYYLL